MVDRERKQKQRDAWTTQERQAYNAKKNDYQKQVRNEETKEEYLAETETETEINITIRWLLIARL